MVNHAHVHAAAAGGCQQGAEAVLLRPGEDPGGVLHGAAVPCGIAALRAHRRGHEQDGREQTEGASSHGSGSEVRVSGSKKLRAGGNYAGAAGLFRTDLGAGK
jgi:hypothetical protein